MKKVILVNVVIILILFALMEFVSYLYVKKDVESFLKPYNENAKKFHRPELSLRYAPVEVFNQQNFIYRQGFDGAKDYSILFLGCSYTYGIGVENQYSLPYQLGKLTNTTTINRGLPGGGLYNALFDLQNNQLYESLKNIPKPKYIVYTYINQHLIRLINPYRSSILWDKTYELHPSFKEYNNDLVQDIPNKLKLILYSTYMFKAYYHCIAPNIMYKKSEDKMIKIFKKLKQITDEKFPNSKFVILLYKDTGFSIMSDELRKELKQSGFIVLDAEELAGHELESSKYRCNDGEHPSGEAFYDVAKGLIKTLKI